MTEVAGAAATAVASTAAPPASVTMPSGTVVHIVDDDRGVHGRIDGCDPGSESDEQQNDIAGAILAYELKHR